MCVVVLTATTYAKAEKQIEGNAFLKQMMEEQRLKIIKTGDKYAAKIRE